MTTETQFSTHTDSDVERLLDEAKQLHEARLIRAVESARHDERERLAQLIDASLPREPRELWFMFGLGLWVGILGALAFAP